MTEAELAAHREAVLDFLANRGVPPEQVIFGIADFEHHDTDWYYTSHVGVCIDRDSSTLLSLIAKDLHNEARQQTGRTVARDAGRLGTGSGASGARAASRTASLASTTA
jgi:hypothetical protein